MMKPEWITVQTPKGLIQAAPSTDPDYPGVWIEVNGIGLVLVEFDNNTEEHVIRVWNSKDPNNDYEYKQVVSKYEEEI